MALTATHLEVLRGLVKLYEEKKKRITSKELAQRLGKHEVTLRNILRTLSVLGLIEARSGPDGGYSPTVKAYEVVSSMGEAAGYTELPRIPLIKINNVPMGLYLADIEILSLNDPRGAKAILKAYGMLQDIREKDRIRIGPLPHTGIVIEGIVNEVNKDSGEILVEITRLLGLPPIKIEEVMTSNPVSVGPRTKVRKVAEIMLEHGYRAIPVVRDKKIIGVVMTKQVFEALLNGQADEPVSKVMTARYYTVKRDESIASAVKLMRKYNIGRLFVVDERGDLIGVITRTDILSTIADLIG